MRVLYDHQIFNTQKRGGVSRYFSVLVQALRRIPDTSCMLALIYSDNEHLRENAISGSKTELILKESALWQSMQKRLRGYAAVRTTYDFLKRRINMYHSIRMLKRGAFDVFHPTYYDSYFLEYLKGKPFVLTIHDMIHEKYPQYFGAHDRTREQKKILAERAVHIIAISENTKNDIVEILKINPDKISVVHHANFLDCTKEKAISLPERFILFVGGRKRYKNFSFFIEAVAPIMNREQDLFVICIGGEPLDAREQNLLNDLGVSNRVIQKNVSDAELTFAYKHAVCFVFPSLYEGFGMPILEAFANGCPVAISNASCFPEIAGDAALYFDPEDKASIERAVDALLYNPEKRKYLIEQGQSRLNEFSEVGMAIKTREVYQSTLRKIL